MDIGPGSTSGSAGFRQLAKLDTTEPALGSSSVDKEMGETSGWLDADGDDFITERMNMVDPPRDWHHRRSPGGAEGHRLRRRPLALPEEPAIHSPADTGCPTQKTGIHFVDRRPDVH